MFLDVKIPVREDVTCCFCQREFLENLGEHEDICGDIKGFDRFDKHTKILEKNLDRLKFQHLEIFCKLLLNEPVPVKQSYVDQCTNCGSYDEHLQGKCLLMDKVAAFNIVTENMRTEELRIKSTYIDLKFEKLLSVAKESQEKNRRQMIKVAKRNLSLIDRTRMSPRTWRMIKRSFYHDLTHLSFTEQREMKKLHKQTTQSKKYNIEAIERSVDVHIEKARELLRMSDHVMEPRNAVRFLLSEHEEEEVEGEEE